MNFEQFLMSKDVLLEKELKRAEQSRRENEDLVDALVRLGSIEEEILIPLKAEFYKVPYIQLKDTKIDIEIIRKIPAKFVYHYNFIPVGVSGTKIKVATADPLDIQTMDDIKLMLHSDLEVVLAGRNDIAAALKRFYGVGAETVAKMIEETETATIKIDIPEMQAQDIDDHGEDASMIKFVNQILLEAYRDRATDIHIEPFEDELRIRYRIDGVLYDTSLPPSIKNFHTGIVSRIKIMANLNIAERRSPQDGRIKIKMEGNDLDLRVSVLPTAYGESVNIRLLSSYSMLMSLKELGISDNDLDILQETIRKPYGMILVTGPTGSGKTTSLYACLTRLNKIEKKIITIEDPIEYQIKGISQIQVMPKIGLTFANGLRSMLRHDPDIMMVGEIRDRETADTAIRIALTGHLVFSTLHTNDAAGAITRLIDMGVEPFLVSSSVECIIAQRLVRVICPECKTEVTCEKELKKHLGFLGGGKKDKVYIGKGCEKCKFTGYQGRTAIYEMLVINDEIRDLIVKRVPANIIKKKALENKMVTLRNNGLDKVREGVTSLEEVTRVTQV